MGHLFRVSVQGLTSGGGNSRPSAQMQGAFT